MEAIATAQSEQRPLPQPLDLRCRLMITELLADALQTRNYFQCLTDRIAPSYRPPMPLRFANDIFSLAKKYNVPLPIEDETGIWRLIDAE